MLVFYFFVFIFGLIVGSFLNCVIYRLGKNGRGEGFPAEAEVGARLPRPYSSLGGRSFCPHCKHILSWQDLIPVFSFLILRGKCRYCRKKISWQYPLVELTTGILFILLLNYELRIMNYGFFDFRFILNSLFLILNSCFLIIIFVYDLKHFIIPDKVIFPAIIIVLIFNLCRGEVTSPLLAGFSAAAFFLFIVLISKGRWLGLGDVKLAFLMGLFLGFPKILVALFLAFFIGAIIGVGLILAQKKTLKSEVPFGPFLVLGTFIALFWGTVIINWYLNLFHGTI